MFGTTSHARSLESRKRLLIAESELNRAQLVEEWQTMTRRVRKLTRRVHPKGTWALAAAALLVAGLTAWRRRPPAPGAAKSSWWQTILNAARVVATIWWASCARGEEETHL